MATTDGDEISCGLQRGPYAGGSRQGPRAAAYPCVTDCGRPAAEWAYDHGDVDELVATVNGAPRRYSLEPARYRPMCRPCHRRFDRTHRALRVYATW